MSDARLQFNALVAGHAVMKADVAMVLCGQDGAGRAHFASNWIMPEGGAPLMVLSGGLHDPPALKGAEYLMGEVLGAGVSPSSLILEMESTNTREQAEWLAKTAVTEEWEHVIIVASAYHIYRAFLTFLKVLIDDGLADDIRLIPMAATHLKWIEKPEGCDMTRLELLGVEFEKIDEYREKGHVATFEEGVDYIKRWAKR